MTRIAFIGAGSTIFMKNIVGDVLHFPALEGATFALMDINEQRLEESALVARKLIAASGRSAQVETTTDQRRALAGADFVVTAFQIGGYEPSTVIDFDIPKQYGLRQTIGDTLGVGGIMRGLRTVPHLWRVAADMAELCPNATLLQYVNPMAINTWAIAERYPHVKQVGLCHSVQNTVQELAHDLDLPKDEIRYRVAGVNHVAFFLDLTHRGTSLYPALREGYRNGSLPKPPLLMPRCANKVRYEVMEHLGYFCTESSEHLAEYVPWFIKSGREDLIDSFSVPLDEYPKRCIEQMADWADQAKAYRTADQIDFKKSHEFAAEIMNAMVTNQPYTIYGNLPNRGQAPQLPEGAAVEVPCMVDANGIQPSVVDDIPPQLVALMRTQINVQELVVRALVDEDIEHVYHAAMMDPHTAAELDLRQIHNLVTDLLAAHGDMLPEFARLKKAA
ncbi:alpha-glucosidase/alpha-galactosidase [Marivita sp. XM-24bin2]|jgi:alpha-galactosidase|uniref:alpha-glucosidase/alpha-galactosidase n=1 Tax=unclassified Marivita TaxID=2632480 RepID=UPI000D7A1C02|nr:alpha-glucosidase/alpha-galactosidase [Marivita sp. XM-24bin2]MCR9110090.1 alpha-glucosidase/alpha-galactosidase [Paracoccaceae bacterium]PWL34290.1 MAG: alpha-glucosidase/alpha-galactosidase [Marivita sp. XM-24bin2]